MNARRCRRFAVFFGLGCSLLTSTNATADWPQFRGVNAAGRYAGPPLPLNFSPGVNERWHLEVPLGHSSPIVVGDRIYLTGFNRSEGTLSLLSIDREKGTVIWKKEFRPDEFEKGHPSFNPASSTPVADESRVVAYFGSYGLVACSRDGEVLWEYKMPLPKSYAGNATSPIMAGDLVYLYRANYVDHFLLALNKQTGKEVWKVEQEEPFDAELACTACPIVVGDQLVVHSARSVQAYDVHSGERRWAVKCATTATSTPIVVGQEVIVAAWNKMGEPSLRPSFPDFDQLVREKDLNRDNELQSNEWPTLWIFHRPEGIEAPQNGATVQFKFADRDRDGRVTESEWETSVRELDAYRDTYKTHGMIAIPLESQGWIEASDVRVLETKSIPEVPSPISDGRFLYFIKNGGVLTCIDLRTGERLYRNRTSGRGTHYASPVIAGQYLLTTSGDGVISVIQLGPEFKLVSTHEMQDSVYATPALYGGQLYVRTHSGLYAFGSVESDP
jgi:outer membrane protein assembly factor BamB